MAEYQPGVCNIGLAEIARRRQAGYIGAAVAIVLLALLVVLNTSNIWRLLLFIPVTVSAEGFLQAYFKFCAAYGFKGVYNLVKPVRQTESIQNAEFRKKDRLKALKITAYSVFIGAAVAVIAYLLPF